MHGLGELEAAVMDVVWSVDGPVKVRDVLDELDTGKELAYTTVMTVMENLRRKDWLDRERDGRAFAYVPRLTRAEPPRGRYGTCSTPRVTLRPR